MILTDREIRLSIREGLIEVDPAPATAAYSSTSLDLTIGENLIEFLPQQKGLDLVVDPSIEGYSYKSAIAGVSKRTTIDPIKGFELTPNVLILAWTQQRVHLRSIARLAARVEGKSSLARFGVAIHITAPTIHAGFDGQIQLEMINHGPLPIRLRTGMTICQLIFEQTLGFPEKGYGGQFIGQTS